MKSSAELMTDARLRAAEKSSRVNGVEAKYWYYPATTTSPEKAKNLILIHGYRGNHHGLEAFAGGLTSFNVYCPDLPGFGASEPLNGEHTLDAYATWLRDFLKAIGLSRPIGVGHSFGTLVVSSSDAKFDLFESITLVNPVGGGQVTGVSKFLFECVKLYYWVAHVMPERIGSRMSKTYLLVDSMSAFTTKTKNKALRKWIKNQHRTHFNTFANSQVVWESYLASTGNVVTPFLKSIKKPVLMIAADLDEITPVETVQEIARTMANAKVHEIKGCGHLVHYEAAQEAVDAMNAFLSKQR